MIAPIIIGVLILSNIIFLSLWLKEFINRRKREFSDMTSH